MMDFRRTLLSGAAATIGLALTGCATIESSSGTSGIAYTLPKGQVQFTLERKTVTAAHVNEAVKAASEAAALAAADDAALKLAQAELEKNKATLKGLTAGTPAYAEMAKNVDIGNAVVIYLTDKLKTDKALSDAAAKTAQAVAQAIGTQQETGAVKVLAVVPDSDRHARFVANMQHLITRDDKIKLGVSNGLLSTGEMLSKDRTGDILVEIAKIASLFVGPLPIGPMTEMKGVKSAEAPPPECPAYHISMVIDPLDLVEVTKLQSALKTAHSTYALDVDPAPSIALASNDPVMMSMAADWAKTRTDSVKDGAKDGGQKAVDDAYRTALANRLTDAGAGSEEATKATETAQGPGPNALKAQSGLFYRAPTSVNLRLKVKTEQMKACGLAYSPQESSVSVTVPDTARTYVVPMDAGAFTTVAQNAAFKDGMVTSFEGNRESELLAIAGVPIQIARAFMSIPTEFLKLRVDYDNAKVAETNAQVEELKAKLDALKAAQDLKNAQSGTTTTDTMP